MQIEVSEKLKEFENRLRQIQTEIDLLDHRQRTIKHDLEKYKEDLVNVHG
jgi:prefoldin subunit 5